MDVISTQAINAYLLQDRRPAPPQAAVEAIKDGVKQDDPTLSEDGAQMLAMGIAARYIDVRV